MEEIIQPLIGYFQRKRHISKWFFIRYNDPKPHLREAFSYRKVPMKRIQLSMPKEAALSWQNDYKTITEAKNYISKIKYHSWKF